MTSAHYVILHTGLGGRFVLAFSVRLVRPHWKWLVIVVAAMLIETAMSLASPWPLKIVLDSVLDPGPSRIPGSR